MNEKKEKSLRREAEAEWGPLPMPGEDWGDPICLLGDHSRGARAPSETSIVYSIMSHSQML